LKDGSIHLLIATHRREKRDRFKGLGMVEGYEIDDF